MRPADFAEIEVPTGSIGGDPSGLSGRVIAVFTREAKDTNELSVLRLAPQTPLHPISPTNEF
jgi:hypothetical protein